MNAERFERNREARHALALSVAGVMAPRPPNKIRFPASAD
jgi:hypothetical protein